MKEFACTQDSAKLSVLLRGIPFLQSFSEKYLEDILFSSSFLEAEPGETIIKEGNPGSRIYILLRGKVQVVKAGAVVAEFGQPGEIFGEMALLRDEKRSASMVAKTLVLCLAIDEKFLDEIESKTEDASYYAAMYGFICRVLAQRLSRTTEQLAKAEKRLSELSSKARQE